MFFYLLLQKLRLLVRIDDDVATLREKMQQEQIKLHQGI